MVSRSTSPHDSSCNLHLVEYIISDALQYHVYHITVCENVSYDLASNDVSVSLEHSIFNEAIVLWSSEPGDCMLSREGYSERLL